MWNCDLWSDAFIVWQSEEQILPDPVYIHPYNALLKKDGLHNCKVSVSKKKKPKNFCKLFFYAEMHSSGKMVSAGGADVSSIWFHFVFANTDGQEPRSLFPIHVHIRLNTRA